MCSSPPFKCLIVEELTVSECDVVRITLNRPKRGNALSVQLCTELVESLRICETKQNVRAILLTGAGRYFCSGMDISTSNQRELSKATQKNGTNGKSFVNIFEKLRHCTKPLIALVNGPALGGGIGLLFLCDFRLVLDSAHIQFSEVCIGMVPAMISCLIVPQIGSSLARRWMLTGRRVTSHTLLEHSLIDTVFTDADDANRAIESLMKEFSNTAPGAVSATKSMIAHVESHSHEENVTRATQVFAERVTSVELQHFLSAVRQRKKPDWIAFVRSKL